MISSMTGYGKGESRNKYYNFKIEIKSVNHRYKNISIKLPHHLNHLEDNIKNIIEQRINRGSIDVYVNLEYLDESLIDVDVDLPLAKSYQKALDEINTSLNLQDKITINHIIAMRDVIKTEKKDVEDEEIISPLTIATNQAVDELIKMREIEGERLKLDMLNKLTEIENYVVRIKDLSPIIINDYKEKLRQNISEILTENIPVDEERLLNEVAYFVDKASVDEELVRLNSHICQFREILNNEDVVGRKLDFLIQEINREINTIGSKSSNYEISNNVVNMKAELEKIREQVQNIE